MKPIKVGDKVMCLFGNSGNKFWCEQLTPAVTVSKIIRHRDKPNELIFEEIPDERFYENDFKKVWIGDTMLRKEY